MAGKKREIQLQAVINNQSLWDEMLQNKGLTVIDVYQAWCGPCKAMQTLFRKLKNELNEDEILHFAVAEADNIVTLQPFRDKCEPIFLFSINGKIVAKIEGANAPLINKKIINLINEERKIAAGKMVRPQYHEIALVDLDTEDAGEASNENVDKLYSIIIIKPEAVITRKAIEIKEKSIPMQRPADIFYKGPFGKDFQVCGACDLCHNCLTLRSYGGSTYRHYVNKWIINAGFVIEAEDKRVLTEKQVREFYSQIADQPEFEDFVPSVTSGLSYILVTSQSNKQEPPWEETVPNPETEHKEPPEDQHEMATPTVMKKKRDSLQEYLERQAISQFCDVEENIDNVNKFIDIFFPDFKSMTNVKLERILALLRPDLFREKKEEVLKIIQDEGFKILMQRQVVLSEEEAQTLCKEYENEDYFENILENMTSGPSLALVLLRDNGLQHWKKLIGPSTVEEAKEYLPESLCIRFATGSLPINQLYGSDSLEAAKKEVQHFFPPQSTLALIKPHVTHEQREEIFDIIKEAGFDITQMKEMLLTKEQADKIYFKIVRKDFYKDVLEVLSEGPSLVMVLTKWNAVSEWRRLMGPTDPDEAKLLSPDSIRAKFGESILRNAAHGSSNTYDAMEAINRVFEDFVPENTEEN